MHRYEDPLVDYGGQHTYADSVLNYTAVAQLWNAITNGLIATYSHMFGWLWRMTSLIYHYYNYIVVSFSCAGIDSFPCACRQEVNFLSYKKVVQV